MCGSDSRVCVYELMAVECRSMSGTTVCFKPEALSDATKSALLSAYVAYGGCVKVSVGNAGNQTVGGGNMTNGNMTQPTFTSEIIRKIELCNNQFSSACDVINGFKSCTGATATNPPITFSVCVPDACTAQDARMLVETYKEALGGLSQQLGGVTFQCAAGPKIIASILTLALAFFAIKW